jgi:bidirectional [NiFe] hydrogenase diaphorase subunit
MDLQKPEPPSDDRRWKLIDSTMRRHGNRRDALIETLHTVQDSFGYLEEEALDYVARSLRVPPSAVYGVATFYHFFNLKPKGEHSCVICTGTACYIKGAGEILEAIEENFGIGPGETTEDGQLSVLTARCLGACSLAPAVVFDGEVTGKLGPEDVVNRLRRWTEDDA